MDKEALFHTVGRLIAAPSCCPELKAAAQAYLNAIGTEGAKDAAEALIAELEEDICPIDNLIALAESDTGRHMFGEETARTIASNARSTKAEGGLYCTCPACSAASELLANADLLRMV